MSARQPARVLHDWHPESDQPEGDWLADQYDQGWVPDHLYGGRPAKVRIDGEPLVHRWAMVAASEDQTR